MRFRTASCFSSCLHWPGDTCVAAVDLSSCCCTNFVFWTLDAIGICVPCAIFTSQTEVGLGLGPAQSFCRTTVQKLVPWIVRQFRTLWTDYQPKPRRSTVKGTTTRQYFRFCTIEHNISCHGYGAVAASISGDWKRQKSSGCRRRSRYPLTPSRLHLPP